MKTIIYFTTILLLFNSLTFSQSVLTYQTGTSLEVQTGASVCADSVIMNGTFTGGGTLCGLLYTLNLTACIEGFYDLSTDLMVSDIITVQLRDAIYPYPIVESTNAVLDQSGNGAFTFSNVNNGTSYYIVLKHRNSIETWSSSTQMFTGSSLNYDFAAAVTQAFGNNMKQVDASPVRFAVYSGDVNQDGIVDASDVSTVDNDAFNSLSGYVTSDLNGDYFVDASDLGIVDNNALNAVSVITP